MSTTDKTKTQTVKISPELKKELENLDNASAFIRKAVNQKLAQDKIQDFDVEQVDLQAKQKSFQLMSDKFASKDDDHSPFARNPRGKNDLKIEEEYPTPQHYSKKIDKFKDELEKLKLEREKVESEKDKAVLQQAINGEGGSKDHFENLKKKLENLDEKIEHKRALVNRLKQFKGEVKEKHEKRQKLQNYISAKTIKEKYLNPITDKLQQDFSEFVSTYEKFKQINSHYDRRINKAGGTVVTSNYGYQQQVGKHLDVDVPSAPTTTDYSDKALKDVLPVSRLPENPLQDSDNHG